MNSYEKIYNGLSIAFEGLGEFLNEFVKNLDKAMKAFCSMQLNHKKPRLPRKTKKKYKKIGIYDDWKKENNLI